MLSLTFEKISFSLLPKSNLVSSFNRYGITRILGFVIFDSRSGFTGKPSETCWNDDACILQSLIGCAVADGESIDKISIHANRARSKGKLSDIFTRSDKHKDALSLKEK